MIRHLGPEDIDIFRRIRLEALRSEPAAFASSSEDWEGLPDAEWRRRLTVNAVFVDFHEGERRDFDDAPDRWRGVIGLMLLPSSEMRGKSRLGYRIICRDC